MIGRVRHLWMGEKPKKNGWLVAAMPLVLAMNHGAGSIYIYIYTCIYIYIHIYTAVAKPFLGVSPTFGQPYIFLARCGMASHVRCASFSPMF